ncbi:Na(+)/H(+) antiporter [Globomyces sp. JEL0801]|nr:Na(+)/H(+) antiporter [Globomyces sp. JEL0801]
MEFIISTLVFLFTLQILYIFRQSVGVFFNDNIYQLLSLIVIVLVGIWGGRLAERVGQDPMLGMLFSGLLLRNLFPSFIYPIPHSWTSILWTTALCSVISRAGLSLMLPKVIPNVWESLFLGTVPVLAEAIMLALMTSVVFHLPLPWAFTLSFGVSTISPGVVVPLLLRLIDNGWGKSRLPPMLLTGLGLDVLVGTAGFGISLASCFGHKHEQDHPELWFHNSWVGRCLEEIGMGLFLGTTFGFVSFVLLKSKRISGRVLSMVMFVVSTVTMIWCKTHGFTGSASFSTFITWSIIANTWPQNYIEKSDIRLKKLWLFFKPFLFPVIGATVSLGDTPISLLLKSFSIVLVSVTVKMSATYITATAAGLSDAEAMFVCGLWSGKASIQATLCESALEMVHKYKLEGTEEEEYAKIVFLCMVSAIVIGAPSASNWVLIYGKNPLGEETANPIMKAEGTSEQVDI